MKFRLSHILLMALLVLLPVALFAQNRTVRGTVRDSSGEPLPGASVMVQGTSRGVTADADGRFELQASASDKLVVSYIGYEDVVVSAAVSPVDVVLSDDANFLQETVVVGYGVQKKATLTGAVSAVTQKEMVITKNENVVNMLSGKVAGVRISQRSSQPGEFDNAIDIRGMGTPLFVVDGIPRDQAYFSRMDANEIESVSVLKDASAAIYGVRAANGVILVTTRHGSGDDGKFDIDLSMNYGWQSFLYVPNTVDAASHMMLINEKNYNGIGSNYPNRGLGIYSWDDIMAYSSGQKTGTLWSRELFKNNVPQSQYNLSVNGGSEKIKYFFNLGYMDMMGSYRSGSLNYHRWNFRSNVDARITSRLRANVQLSGYMDEKNQPFTTIWAVYKKAWTYRPTSEAWIDGDHSLPGWDDQMLESENPVAATDSDFSGFRQEKRYNLNAALALTYDIPYVDGLNLRAFYSYDYYTTDNTEYQKTYYLFDKDADGNLRRYVRNSGDDSYVQRSADPNSGQVMQLSVNYDRTFANAHHVSVMGMYEQSYNKWDNFLARRVMMLDKPYLFSGEETNQVGKSNGLGDLSRRAWIGHLNYDFKGRYLLDFAIRHDASSRFPKASRWGWFPSISAGWRISEEPFVKNNAPWITNLKIRGSWGRLGDDSSAGTYPSIYTGYQLMNNKAWIYDDSVVTGIGPTAIPNPNLTWYTATTVNLGLDFNLWNQKLGGTFEVFRRHRDGLLASSAVTLPGNVGATMPQENIESDITFGYEFQLSHRNRIGEFGYNISGFISAAKNRWDYHLDSAAGNSMENWYRGSVSGRNKDIWFSVEEAGRFTSYEDIQNHPTTGWNYGSGTLPGDYYYADWNEDGVVNDADRHPVASYNLPVFNYGITLGADWKGLDISMNWAGSAGVYSEYGEVFGEVGPFNGGAVLDMYLDRWHTANQWDDPWNPSTQWVPGYYPATGHSFTTGTTGIKNMSYLRLKSLEIGYTFPVKWTSFVRIKSLRVYLSAYNLLTFCGDKYMDPERPGTHGGASNGNVVLNYNYPVNRTINVGASVKF